MKYCYKCGEAMATHLVDVDSDRSIQPVGHCTNPACPFWGILVVLGIDKLEDAQKQRKRFAESKEVIK